MLKVKDSYIAFEEPPIIENGAALVPARFLSEYLGAEVTWDNGIISVAKSGKKITLKADSNIADVDGTEAALSASVRIINDRSYVPMRFIAEALDLEVNWNADLNIAYLN
ncbi:MAG: copper amine oxidase N-terminal domain-containing protein [Oscillospiraceae bacterium]|nr:copper amine oxidase N-terminal domain-containing protein [Oscillospiraceae bacterium]